MSIALETLPSDHASVQIKRRHSMHITGAFSAQCAARHLSVIVTDICPHGQVQGVCSHTRGFGSGAVCPSECVCSSRSTRATVERDREEGMQLVGAFVAGGATNQRSQLTLIPQEAQGDLAWSTETSSRALRSLTAPEWVGRKERGCDEESRDGSGGGQDHHSVTEQ